MITISIVSHNQAKLVDQLLNDLSNINFTGPIILTSNIPGENFTIPDKLLSQVRLISNSSPKGFGANHNYAFLQCKTAYFAVLNPDIRITLNPFDSLLQRMTDNIVMVAPAILSLSGRPEDNARDFPTPLSLIKKALHLDDGYHPYELGAPPFSPDWIGGMFMVIKSDAFRQLQGFDEAYFLYYEDVDLCLRLRKTGWSIRLDPAVSAIHDAQRSSHRNIQYLKWHVLSLLRYLIRHSCWLMRRKLCKPSQ